MKKKLSSIIFIFIFLAGLSLLLYPYISNEWNTYRQKQLIIDYEQVVVNQTESNDIDYEEEWSRAKAYNEALLPYMLPDSFAIAAMQEDPDEEYMACLNLAGNGMMGVVEIPRINIRIPIYHTTGTEVLEKAAGHLEGSSLPIGGTNSHAVISAHRGLPSAALFTDLDKLEKGDHFLLHVLDEILCYEVDRISVVEPSETEELAIVEEKDLVTLLTCTPYGVNSHRLLVRGHRVAYEPEVAERIMTETRGSKAVSIHTNYLLWVIVGLCVTFLVVVGMLIWDRRYRSVKRLARRKKDMKKE